jgi:hypothetical protein
MSISTFNQKYAALDSSTAGAFVFETISAQDWAITKLAFGDTGTATQVDATNALPVTAGRAAHDAAVSGNPVLVGGYASAAAPSDVSGDGDAVRAWMLRNGAQAVVLTAAGALVGGDASNGIDVDVTRLPASTNTLEVVGDVAHDAAAAGNPLLLGAYASAAAPSDVSGDADAVRLWALRNGALAVNITAAGALIPGSASTGLLVNPGSAAYVDDADWTALSSSHLLVGGIYQSSPGSITNGDTGPLRLDENGRVMNSPRAASTALADNVSNTINLFVDPTGSAAYMATAGFYYDGTTWDRVRGDSTDGLLVNLGTNNDVIQGTASSLKCEPAGNVAHDSADSGNPLKIGGIARQANPTAVTALDRTDAFFDDVGRLVVREGQCRDLITDQATTITASTSETTVLTAVAATFLDITAVVVANSSATPTEVTFKQSTGGTTRFVLACPANDQVVFTPPRPINQAAVNENWTATCADSVTSIFVYVQAEKNV